MSKRVRGWSKLTVKEGQGLLPLESALEVIALLDSVNLRRSMRKSEGGAAKEEQGSRSMSNRHL